MAELGSTTEHAFYLYVYALFSLSLSLCRRCTFTVIVVIGHFVAAKCRIFSFGENSKSFDPLSSANVEIKIMSQ